MLIKKPSSNCSSTLLQRFIFLCTYLSLNTMLLVLFWRFSSRLPLSAKLHSPSFTQFSPLSSSSAFPSTPLVSVVSELLIKECGFSSSQVTSITRAQPRLLRNKSDHTAREAIRLLEELGFTEKKLKATILVNPALLTQRSDRQLKPKIEHLKNLGLATQDVAHIISRRPRFLKSSLENCIVPRILRLETLFGSKIHLCKALRTTPTLLEMDFEKQVKPKTEYLKTRIGNLKDSIVFARYLRYVISQSIETLEAKIHHMENLGLEEEEINHMLKVYPQILNSSTKKMTENIDFLVRTVGIELKIVTLDAVILNLSLEKRLKPRYEVFKYLRESSHVKSLPSPIRFFRLSESAFFAKFGNLLKQSPRAGISDSDGNF